MSGEVGRKGMTMDLVDNNDNDDDSVMTDDTR